MSHVNYVHDHNFENDVLKSDTPVLVDFYADWCAPCRAIAPILEEIAEEVEGEFNVAKLDIDTNGGTAATYHVESIPTLILFKDGKPVERWVGVIPKEQILNEARKHTTVHVPE